MLIAFSLLYHVCVCKFLLRNGDYRVFLDRFWRLIKKYWKQKKEKSELSMVKEIWLLSFATKMPWLLSLEKSQGANGNWCLGIIFGA